MACAMLRVARGSVRREIFLAGLRLPHVDEEIKPLPVTLTIQGAVHGPEAQPRLGVGRRPDLHGEAALGFSRHLARLSFTRNSTIFWISARGTGLSRGNCTEPFAVW